MGDVMDKLDSFFKALELAGIEITDGQTAIVCKDGVVVLTADEEGVDAAFCNNKIDFDYELGITLDDVDQFNAVAGVLDKYLVDEEE